MSAKLTSLENHLEKIQFRMKHVPDITVLFGPDGADQCKANSTFLAMQSDVFDSMFFDKLPMPQQIHLPDMEKRTFVDLMDFMYVDYVKLTPDNVLPLLRASIKYKVAELTKQCSNYVIEELINEDNFWQIRQEYASECSVIADKCLDQIVANPTVHFGKPSFLNISADELLAIVNHPKLKSCTQQDLRMVVTRWLKHNYTTAPKSDTEGVFACLERLQKCPALCEHDHCSVEKTVSALVEKPGAINVIHFEGKPNDGRKFKADSVNSEAFTIIRFVISIQEHLKSIGLGILVGLIAIIIALCFNLYYNYIIENMIQTQAKKSCTPVLFGIEFCSRK
jgi:BTB/POZ domain